MKRPHVSYSRQKNLLSTKYSFFNIVYGYAKYLKNLLYNNYPLAGYPNESNPPFFIIGAGRSGNTLLRAILTVHPDICIPPESYVIGPTAKKWDLIQHHEWKDIVKIVISEFESHHHFHLWDFTFQKLHSKLFELTDKERSYARIIDELFKFYSTEVFPSAKRWGDKTPRNTYFLPWIDKVFPNAQYIHIIRDGRDVVSSYLNTSFWKFDMKYAAIEWQEAIKSAISFRSKPSNKYLEIRYEDLVNNTNTEVQRVCKFLDIEFSEEMLTPYSVVDKLGDSSQDFHKNLAKPISNKSVGQWKVQFNNDEQLELQSILKNELTMLGYE